ncbi:hypothetical protein D8674_022924 [Pyrus ussuriensis x Pyrus communis]|uniref:Uncharacterized protein n=1 Tax=Pyrus ussuriensis x Pyrus communis TaxID=2448454 RepID=A0A5N5GL89_9ROSA|nr:hypothetical protein D8674_022924 [Pyrus ussuriensis x Pyrus communis]
MLRLKPNRLRTFTATAHSVITSEFYLILWLMWDKGIPTTMSPSPFILHLLKMTPASNWAPYSPFPKAPTHPRKLKLMTEKLNLICRYQTSFNRAKRPLMPLESSMRLKDDSSKLGSDWEVVVRSFSRSIDPLEEKEEYTQMCTSCGSLEGLVRTKEDAVDALFSVEDNAIKRDSSPEVRSKQSKANYDLRLEISRQLADVRRLGASAQCLVAP